MSSVISACECVPGYTPIGTLDPYQKKWCWALDAARDQLVVSLPPAAARGLTPLEARAGIELSYEDFKRVHQPQPEPIRTRESDDMALLPNYRPQDMKLSEVIPHRFTPELKQWFERNEELLLAPRRMEEQRAAELRAAHEAAARHTKRIALQIKCVEAVARATSGDLALVQFGDEVNVEGVVTVRLDMAEVRAIVERARKEAGAEKRARGE